MTVTSITPDPSGIDEKSLRRALGHLLFWHRAGSLIGFAISFAVAFVLVHYVARIDPLRDLVLGLIDALPFVTTARRVEVVLFVIGALMLLGLTSTGMAIASDLVRGRVIARTNAQPEPVALAEAMKLRLRARSGRLEQQYRFFPKFAEGGKLQPNGLFVGIGTLTPFLALMVFFFFYFRW